MGNRRDAREEYSAEELHQERKYGMFWYSWLWHILRPLALFVCVGVAVAGVVMAGWNWVNNSFFAPIDAQDHTPIAFSVASGSSLTKVANGLEEKGLIHNRTVFKYCADFMGYGQKIQAGDYVVSKSMSMYEIMDLLTTGDGNPLTRNITVIPGWTVRDIAAYLKKEGIITDENGFLALCRDGQAFSEYYYVHDVLETNDVGNRLFVLEGYLAPDTYEIYSNAAPEEIIRKLLSQTEAVYQNTYHDRAEELGMTMDEIITLASMIEKEAKTGDFTKVSAIFHNRLKKNMTLGSDVTIKYASGVKRMSLTNEDLNVNSPFNSYKYKGLPPGPICSPSANAIYAALYPDEQFIEEQYLYFCSKDPHTGELQFSRTLEEHEYYVKLYAPLWQAWDKEQGL